MARPDRREGEVADLFARGLTAEEIAARRGTSIQTVRTQLKLIYEKTGIRRKGTLIRLLDSMRPAAAGTQAAL